MLLSIWMASRRAALTYRCRFGLEGLVTFKKPIAFDPENYYISVEGKDGDKVHIGVFDKVKVKISVDKVCV